MGRANWKDISFLFVFGNIRTVVCGSSLQLVDMETVFPSSKSDTGQKSHYPPGNHRAIHL